MECRHCGELLADEAVNENEVVCPKRGKTVVKHVIAQVDTVRPSVHVGTVTAYAVMLYESFLEKLRRTQPTRSRNRSLSGERISSDRLTDEQVRFFTRCFKIRTNRSRSLAASSANRW